MMYSCMSEQLNEAISYQERQSDTSRISNFLEFMFTHLEYNLRWLQWPRESIGYIKDH